MNNIENRAEILNSRIEELKSEILGEWVCNDEEDRINDLIDLAMMLGETYVYRDNTVTKIVKPEDVVEAFKED